MKAVGVFGGSFNPVHIGHLMVASYIGQTEGLDEIWLSLSPANPLKEGVEMASDGDRFAMLQLATGAGHGLRAVDYELSLPRPSYTCTYLDTLATRYPDIKFTLIIGSDNWLIFSKWKDYEKILSQYGVLVYPRPGYPIDSTGDSRAHLVKAPVIDLSSSFIRQSISRGLDMNFFLPAGVYNYIMSHKLYVI